MSTEYGSPELIIITNETMDELERENPNVTGLPIYASVDGRVYPRGSSVGHGDPTHAVLLRVQYDGRIFRLNEPIYLARYAENGYIYLESKLLSIIGYGCSERDAVNSFHKEFAVLWDAVAQCPDASLTPEARNVKLRILEIVNTVVPE